MSSSPTDLNAAGLVASLVQSYLSFAGSIISAALWPIFALVVIWILRPHVLGLLPFIEQLEFGGARVQIKRHLARGEQVAAAPEMKAPAQDPAATPLAQPPDRPEEDSIVRRELETLRTRPGDVSGPVLLAVAHHGSSPSYPAVHIAADMTTIYELADKVAEAADIPAATPQLVAFNLAVKGYALVSLVDLLRELETIHSRVMSNPSSADTSDAIRFSALAEKARVQLKSALRVAEVQAGKAAPAKRR